MLQFLTVMPSVVIPNVFTLSTILLNVIVISVVALVNTTSIELNYLDHVPVAFVVKFLLV
jgi:hypothetical protein